jgi:hypothetical protein
MPGQHFNPKISPTVLLSRGKKLDEQDIYKHTRINILFTKNAKSSQAAKSIMNTLKISLKKMLNVSPLLKHEHYYV